MLLLNKACLTFEPNDPEFIRVTHRIYEYINSAKEYEILSSTRFFGPMVFYLTWYKKLDNIMSYYLRNSKLDDCMDVIRLHSILHEDATRSKSLLDKDESALTIIEVIIIFKFV